MKTIKSGIYLIISKFNNNKYVGSSKDIYKRWRCHFSLLRKNKHHSPYLQNHYNKYGESDLELQIIELIDTENLTSQELKEILLKKEQDYLNNIKDFKFNNCPNSFSCLGRKRINAKHYRFIKNDNSYRVTYTVYGNLLSFGCFQNEMEAINRVNFLRTLTEQELQQYWIDNHKNKTGSTLHKRRNTKGYCYDKTRNKWMTYHTINNKRVYLGRYNTKEEAIQKLEQFKSTSS